MFGEGARDVAEGQAGLHRGVQPAGNAQMIVLVPAKTRPDADEAGLLDDVRRPLVIQDMVCLLRHEDGLVDKDASQLRLHPEEEILDEILLDIDILVKKLAQVLLVDVAPGAHEGELEKADHRRRQDKLTDPMIIGIDEQSLFTEMIQQLFCFRLRGIPQLRRFFQGKRADREFRHPFRLFFGKEHLQDLRERLRGRRALGEPVDPVFQIPVCVPRCQMSHYPLSLFGNELYGLLEVVFVSDHFERTAAASRLHGNHNTHRKGNHQQVSRTDVSRETMAVKIYAVFLLCYHC